MNDSATTEILADPYETIRMLQKELEETNRGLVALTLELEQRVDARTAELQAAHRELQAIPNYFSRRWNWKSA
jgi:nitrate/nitrite-specific signal transduction histidine kinase